jgi:hypothetical protein
MNSVLSIFKGITQHPKCQLQSKYEQRGKQQNNFNSILYLFTRWDQEPVVTNYRVSHETRTKQKQTKNKNNRNNYIIICEDALV